MYFWKLHQNTREEKYLNICQELLTHATKSLRGHRNTFLCGDTGKNYSGDKRIQILPLYMLCLRKSYY